VRQVTLRDLEDLGYQRFEDLVAALVQRDHPEAEHLQAPDAGADILLKGDGSSPKVWQVKHYPKTIHWEQCEKSLDDAVREHGAGEVVFVFPRKMSSAVKKSFRLRLVERKPDIEVTYWSGSEVLRRLRAAPELVEEFFDPDPKVLRGILADEVAGRIRAELGPVGGFTDTAQERFALSDRAAKEDRYFRSEVTLTTGDTPETAWKEPPYIVAVGEMADDRKLRVATWPEQGKDVPPAQFGFTDDETGRCAQRLARDRLARGQEVTLTSGVHLTVPRLPKAIRATLPADAEVANPRLVLQPNVEEKLLLRVSYDGETLERTFVMRGMPPGEESPEGTSVSFGCIDRGVGLWFDVAPQDEPTIAVRTRFALLLGEDHATNAKAARFARAFAAGQGAVYAPDLLLDEWQPIGAKEADPALVFHAEVLMHLFESVAYIEQERGVTIELPDEIDGREVEIATGLAHALKTGRGSVTVEMLAIEMPTIEFPGFIEATKATTSGRIPINAQLLEHHFELGVADVELPPPSLELPTPRGGGTTHVELRWTPPVSIPFQLVEGDEQPPVRTELPIWVPGRA
jgi:Restriction endonuclease